MKKLLIGIMSILLLRAAFAFNVKGSDAPSFDIKCKTKTSEFILHFKSKSGEVSEDDMSITLDQKSKTIPIPLKPRWYKLTEAVRDVNKLPTICKHAEKFGYGYPAFAMSPSQILIFFKVDARPGFDSVSLILYDTETMQILDQKEGFELIKERNMAFRITSKGLEQRMIHDWLKNTGSDSPESAIEDWMPIRIANKKIVTGWKTE